MAGGKNNTQRIEDLEGQATNWSARLQGYGVEIQLMKEQLNKCLSATEGHTSRITVMEQQVLVVVDLKRSMEAIAAIEKDLVAIRKDLESLQGWKNDLKKEKEEVSRRRWAFGPNITAAAISGLIALIGIGLSYWLNRPR
jgi:uncharacterized coiled-coil DUF342 family protein